MGVLSHVCGQLEMITKTLGILDQRLTSTEEQMATLIEERSNQYQFNPPSHTNKTSNVMLNSTSSFEPTAFVEEDEEEEEELSELAQNIMMKINAQLHDRK